MGERLTSWKNEIIQHKTLIAISVIFLILALTLNYSAGNYADRKGTVKVPDLVLDSIPTLDLNFVFIYGFLLVLGAMLAYPLFFKVKELHVAISQFSLLVLIRSFFVTLTHLSMPVGALIFNAPKIFSIFNFQNALFFSGHTSIPFLGFLLFRKEKIGIFFLIMTFVMAATVLFMHVHYSIDVFAAIFITYGSYKLGNRLFRKINNDTP